MAFGRMFAAMATALMLATALAGAPTGAPTGALAQSQATKTGTGKPAGTAADEQRGAGISTTAIVAGIVVAAAVGISLSALLGGGSSPSGTK